MGFLNKFTASRTHEHKNAEVHTSTDSDSLDLVDRNEKEIQEHPDEITADAQPGVQKAEAIALVWDKKSLCFIYAWSVVTTRSTQNPVWDCILTLIDLQDLDMLLHARASVSGRL